jgi:hypothetical protein
MGEKQKKKKEDYPQPFFSLYCRLAASNQDQQRDVGNPSHRSIMFYRAIQETQLSGKSLQQNTVFLLTKTT